MDTDRMRGDDDEVNQSAQSRAQEMKSLWANPIAA